MEEETNVAPDEFFLACYRGADKDGALSDRWFLITEAKMSLEGAMQETLQFWECGILPHSHLAEFRICQPDGLPVKEAKPPHAVTLQWQQYSQ